MYNRIKIIAISADTEIFKNERLLDKAWAKKFPGALWIPLLAEKLRNKQLKVTTADVALSHVTNGYWDADEIGIIQHLDDPETVKLIEFGAKPLLITAMESPIYVPSFFKKGNSISSKFPQRVMLSGLFDSFTFKHGINHPLRFPSYNKEDLQEISPWQDRQFMTMVVRNMYSQPFSPLFLRHPLDILRLLLRAGKRCMKLSLSEFLVPSKKFNYKQLHDKRLSAIIFFGGKKCLKLYGYGWDNINNLPRYYRKKLLPLFKILNPQPCEDKINAIKNYKFALCFENASYKGGISEKIIDCFIAGVIPVYLGAFDIEKFIPTDSFVDVRQFQSWEDLFNKLNSIGKIEASQIINNGRNYLLSKEGQLHSYDGFASFIENLVLMECDNLTPN